MKRLEWNRLFDVLSKISSVVSILAFLGIGGGMFILNQSMQTINSNIVNSTNTFNKNYENIEQHFEDVDNHINQLHQLYDSNQNNPQILGDNNSISIFNVEGEMIKNNTAPPQDWIVGEITQLIDSNTHNAVSVEMVAYEKIIIPYTKGEDLALFCGQLDGDGFWDGYCQINNYSSNILVSVVEGNYNHGKLINYRMIKADKTRQDNILIWSYTKRDKKESFNLGITINYYRYDEEVIYDENKVNEDSLNIDSIISVDSIRKMYGKKLQSYYVGNTSNGVYEDASGNAYLATYVDDDGNHIITLYNGKFSNGEFNDNAINAQSWEISTKNTDYYYYYKGQFDKNKSIEKKNSRLVEQGDIQNYIGDTVYECPLNWDESRFFVK